jgi:acyl-CoA synthetase (AMP-forming)/AMP-acid ligase II
MFALHRILGRAATLYADRPAVVDGHVRLTYGAVAERVQRLAGMFAARGLKPGDRVALFGRNSFRSIEVHFACAHAGLILIPLNIRLARAEIEFILKETDARLLLRTLPLEVTVPQTLVWEDEDALSEGAYERAIAAAEPVPPCAVDVDDIAQIFYTSGTTGQPKGVCLTHRNLTASALDSIIGLEMNERDVWLHASPMFHLVDAFAIWGVSLVGGKHVVAHFEPETFGPLVERESITKTSLPPTLLDKIVRQSSVAEYDLRSLDRISYGGSPMQDAVYRRCVETLKCRLLQAYGLSEGSGFVCHQMPGDNPDLHTLVNTVGRPTVHVDVALFDGADGQVADGEVGELCLRGARIMREYWKNPAATQAAFRAGWYRSGDLGVRDATGQFRIVGRKKEMIISGGENVYPAEVVNALIAHPRVAEAAVFGVPSERWGEEVRAVIYPLDGDAGGLTAEALIVHCRELVGGYKVPKVIHISIEPLPKSGPGKIATATLRAHYLQKDST